MNQPAPGFDRIADARSHFPALERWTYLDLGGRGVLSRNVRAAIDAHLDERMYNGGNKNLMFRRVEETRAQFAQLINASPGEIAYTKNVSDGLNMVATAFDWKRGDNVIICAELEHPNNIYPWLNLQRQGLELRAIRHRNGHMPVDDMIASIDSHTRIVTASTVTFSPGFRTDIDTLGKVCREHGVLFLVDAAQSAGVLETDVVRSNVDALAVSTQKGLLGLYGMGFLYVRNEWAERMKPAYLARFGVDLGNADAHESDVGTGKFSFMAGARRFDLGNYNYLGVAAANASLAFLLELGAGNVEAYTVELAHALSRGLLDLGLPVCGGAPTAHIGHTITVGEYGSGTDKHSSDEKMNMFYHYLLDHRVKLSMRRGVLRFSVHVYNNLNDVQRVLDLARDFQKRP